MDAFLLIMLILAALIAGTVFYLLLVRANDPEGRRGSRKEGDPPLTDFGSDTAAGERAASANGLSNPSLAWIR